MRTRDEVLREWDYISESECTWLELELIDRIRELEAQLTLPPIREKFVRVSDELVAELKAAPSKPVTVAIVEDGNELHMTFTESQQAASEPVALPEKRHIQIHKSATLTPATENATAVFFSDDWYSVGKDGYVCRIHSVDRASADSLNTLLNEEVDEHHPYRVLRVALVDESAHPSAAGVRVTEAMVNAAAVCMSDAWHEGEIAWADLNENVKTAFRTMARDSLTAALTTASEGASASRDDDTCTGCNGTGYNPTRERPCDCHPTTPTRGSDE